MVAVTRSLLALLLCQALLGGAAGLMPEVGRRRFSEPGRAASAAQRPEDLLSEFELRLLHMFGLKRRPSPGKDVVIPPYMLDLYRLHAGQQLGQPAALGFPLERAASRANTVRSFHHEEVLEELPETSGKTARRFFFNLTSIPNEESITSAELQIFRQQVHGAFENNSSYHHRINIYEIIKPATATSKDPVTRLLDTRNARGNKTRKGQKGWRSPTCAWLLETAPSPSFRLLPDLRSLLQCSLPSTALRAEREAV
ncbi:bone morphogenetic protein 2 isoform X2 [Oenanthe melanoleuca]|uniref:bone morphogenetic protein 2 isoform X2 n=1 Tax=Oenanthe melanoleuca TaxID=2939378 RepID=UPI0024C12597|nr:bone morphogenetic protein 2 isoform X2 [Oenanthe melanoleuca]